MEIKGLHLARAHADNGNLNLLKALIRQNEGAKKAYLVALLATY